MTKKVLCCLLVLLVSLASIYAKKTIDEKNVALEFDYSDIIDQAEN